MVCERNNKLRRNFRLMFWIQALTEVKVINVVSTIFYIYRGLTLSQILLLAVVFAVVSMATEIPSSYLADKWSRKGLILISLFTFVAYWLMNIFCHGFGWFLIANSLYALAYSMMSGTDEALIYDTNKELGIETEGRKKLGKFFSGQRLFKIITPLIAVIIARHLDNFGFVLILTIDVMANILALFLATRLIEPEKILVVEKIESGVMLDAINLFRNSRELKKIILNRSMYFVVIFSVWRISSEYFQELSTPIIWIGIMTSFFQLIIFVFNVYSHIWLRSWSDEKFVNTMNLINVISVFVIWINQILFKNIAVILLAFAVMNISEVVRWPFFSNMFNKVSSSYNRATTLSLANLFNSVIQVPFFISGAIVIYFGYNSFFTLMLITVLISYGLLYLDNNPVEAK